MQSKTSNINWQEGWDHIASQLSNFTGTFIGDSFGKISRSIQDLETTMNETWSGNQSGDSALGGYVAETRHSGSFNINATIKGSEFRTHVGVDERHDIASPDIIGSWGEDFGLKYMKDAQSSANAQAKSFFQRYCEYKSNNPDLSIEDYMKLKNFPEDTPLMDSIYGGQTRIIPADQLEAAKEYLRWKIAKEAMTRPEQVQRYQETLDNLQSVVMAPDGTQSVELTKEQSQKLARLAREGKYRAYSDQFCSDDILKWNDYVGRSLEAGATAATITFTMKMAPVIWKMITEMVDRGEIDPKKLKQGGLEALPATAESFIRGGVAAMFTLAYETGKLGDIFKHMSPEQVPTVIGALTVVAISTIKDAIALSQHEITPQEFVARTQQTIFVTSCAVGLGFAAQTLLPALPFAYFIGNVVGTVVGTITFKLIDNVFVALCVENGYTFFGLVHQDYALPEDVLKELNIDWNEVDANSVDETKIDVMDVDMNDIDQCEGDYVKMLSRGVFKVHHIGYLYR